MKLNDKDKIEMKEEKAKEVIKNELDDSELDQVAGGLKFHIASTDYNSCFKCDATIDPREDHRVVLIYGEYKLVCKDCARNL